ncbi:MAG: hypothetical protein AB8B70_09985, partial [Prochlorococcus sp.]
HNADLYLKHKNTNKYPSNRGEKANRVNPLKSNLRQSQKTILASKTIIESLQITERASNQAN